MKIYDTKEFLIHVLFTDYTEKTIHAWENELEEKLEKIEKIENLWDYSISRKVDIEW